MAMIVCPETEAAAVGGAVFEAGGNAADAAVAAAFAECVVNPLMCSLSGTAILLHTDPAGRATVLNGEAAIGSGPVPAAWVETLGPRAEEIGRFPVASEDNQAGPASSMVPGFVAVCGALHARFGSGRLTWAELLSPAARLAREGTRVDRAAAAVWARGIAGGAPGYPTLAEKLARDDTARAIFLNDGAPYAEGDLLVQPTLADTLDRLGRAGPNDFYRGEIGRAMADDLESRGALVRRQDIERYEAIDQAALAGRFAGHDLQTTPPASPGVQLLEMLAIVEAAGIDLADFDAPETVDLLARVMRAGFVDNRDIKALDPAESDDWVRAMTDPARHRAWAERIRARAPMDGAPPARSMGTTHLVALDGAGGAVSFTHSVGTAGGSGAICPSLGFLYNNFLGHFDPRPGLPMSITPGRRIGSGLPTVARKDGRVALVIGAPGGSRIITSVFQVVLDVLARGTPVAEAVRRPRFHSEEENLVLLEPGWPRGFAAALGRHGQTVGESTYQARVQAIAMAPDGTLAAGIDPRGGAAWPSSDNEQG